MDLNKACNILHIEISDITNKKKIRKAYHRQALKYHPDKYKNNENSENNIDISPEEKFKEIQEAYEFLQMYSGEKSSDNYTKDYRHYVKVYVSSLFPNDIVDKTVLDTIIDKIIKKFEKKSIELFHKLSGESFIELFSLLKKNIYILNPTLDDLLNKNVFRLQHENQEFLVPLWQSEIDYEYENTNLTIKCIPELPDHITIDPENNIHISVRISLYNLFQKHQNKVSISVGNQTFDILLEDLTIRKHQEKIFENCAIPQFVEKDIFNVEKLSNIIVHIEIIEINEK